MLLTAEQVMECPLIILPDMNQADIERAWNQMIVRHRLLDDFYLNLREGRWKYGQIEEMLDCLAEHQIDPDEFGQVVAQNVELVLTGQVTVDSDAVL